VICDIPERGNPADDQLLDGLLDKARRAGLPLRTVLADRGFGTLGADEILRRHAVRDSVIPRRGNAAAIQKTRSWRRRYRFRNGAEARISQLKRNGLARTRLRGLPGAQTWVGGITLAHNLQRLAALTA
jgi:IS5 family transposase